MPRFFVDSGQIAGSTVTITGENAHHISRSLRMAVGETVTVCDGTGTDYLCRLSDFSPDAVTAEILSQEPSSSEPPYLVRVFQALPKGDKLDEVIQKAVECGAREIIPFESSRCVVRLGDGKKDRERTERRCRIARTAAGQCGRAAIPVVLPSLPFAEALRQAAGADLALFCYEGEGTQPLGDVLDARHRTGIPATVSVMVGSEGGFSTAEAEAARAAGMTPVGLGSRILRTETAAPFVLACLSLEWELRTALQSRI